MADFFEEYGFIALTAICAVIAVAAISAAFEPSGAIGEAVVQYIESIVGG